MRKKQKMQILNLITTIFEAHNEIKKLLEQKKITDAINILSSCQDAIMSIGKTLADILSEDAPIIDDIIKYNDLLYDISISLNENKELNINTVYKTINKTLLNKSFVL